MAVMFFHIPRTGGSSVWHNLAHAASKKDVIVADIYHASKELVNNPFDPNTALASFQEYVEKNDIDPKKGIIYHHHTNQHIEYFCTSDDIECVTILRDPTSRLVSEVFHIKKFLVSELLKSQNGGEPSSEFTYHKELFGPELFNAFLDQNLPPEQLLLIAAKNDFYRNYYLNIFTSFLKNKAGSVGNTLSDKDVINFAKEVQKKFACIGNFSDLRGFTQAVHDMGALDYSQDDEFITIKNGSDIPLLSEKILNEIKKINRLDYLFYNKIFEFENKSKIPQSSTMKKITNFKLWLSGVLNKN